MALFDKINSRYTKSMEHGGSYERDAAIGGYDRKELRGLSKQAKRGTLTQRERARYKYLKDERGGRRKRGLLAGLGGAGATLAALAAAGKIGGGGAGGAALMDAIKSRIDDKRKSRADELGEKGEGSMEGVSSQEAQEMLTDSQRGLMESGPGIGEAPVSSNMQQPSELDILGDYGLLPEGSRKVSQDTSRTQEVLGSLRASSNRGKSPRVTDPRDFSDLLSDDVGEGDLYEAARFSNSPTNINEATGLRSRSVDLGSDFPAEIPESQSNTRAIEYSNNLPPAVDANDALTGIFNRTGQRPVRANSVDPMGILGGDSRDGNVSEAQREEDAVNFLSMLNKDRVKKGLPEAKKLTMEAIKETGKSTSDLMNPRQPGQIQTNRSEKNLPQLEALEQLKKLLGNRYR